MKIAMNSIVNKHTFLAALLVLVMLLPGCSDSRSPMDSDAPVSMSFDAGIEEPDDTLSGTRTLLNGSPSDATRSLLWQSSDAICVSTGSTTAKFTVSSGTGSTTASFSGSISQTGTYYAAYPYSMVSGYSSGSFTINLPSIQKYRSGGIQTDSYPMVAQLSGSKFNFKNLCGILVINLSGSTEVSSISFSGKDQSGNAMKVAGQGTVSMSYSSAPSLQMKQTAQTSVTLDCEDSYGNGVTLGSTATPFHLVLPAGTYSSFTLTVTTTDGETMTVNAVRPLTITRSRRTTTGALPFKADGSQSATHEYVDLGLSVKWATCNVGASKPEEYGDYFAWGATEPWYEPGYAQENPQSHWKSGKSGGYNWVNTPYQTANTTDWSSTKWTKYLGSTSSSYKDPSATNADALKTVLDLEDDAAHVNWGGAWRMPTRAEQDELRNNCTWTWTTINGIKGYKVQSNKSGYTDRWIFLPAAGYRDDTSLDGVGARGYYWSSSLYTDYPYCAYYLYFYSGDYYTYLNYRVYGRSVRPVCQ